MSIKKFIKPNDGVNDKLDDSEEEQSIDYSTLPKDEIRKLLFNQIIKQSLRADPVSQILLMATKLVDLFNDENKQTNPLEQLSTDELILKIQKLV